MGSLVVACELLVAACMWDLVPWPGIKTRPPALGARSLNHCAAREVPYVYFITIKFFEKNIQLNYYILKSFEKILPIHRLIYFTLIFIFSDCFLHFDFLIEVKFKYSEMHSS